MWFNFKRQYSSAGFSDIDHVENRNQSDQKTKINERMTLHVEVLGYVVSMIVGRTSCY